MFYSSSFSILRSKLREKLYTLIMTQWKWFVYIIECADGFYYTGMTWNLAERLEQHRSGKGSRFTMKHGFKRLCFTEEFTDVIAARNREYQLKDFSRKKKEALFNVAE
jgi:putative endonuclease